jgi:hypothetical protein
MKLFVPACGDRVVLTKAWTFMLFNEYRNNEFAKARGLFPKAHDWREPRQRVPVTLPQGTVLECDRVYIRASSRGKEGDENYDSLTWKIVINGKAKAKQRFWAKLSDCREMCIDVASLYEDRVKE